MANGRSSNQDVAPRQGVIELDRCWRLGRTQSLDGDDDRESNGLLLKGASQRIQVGENKFTHE
jgi:hypothetical protein